MRSYQAAPQVPEVLVAAGDQTNAITAADDRNGESIAI
jgi:hypothetical protein